MVSTTQGSDRPGGADPDVGAGSGSWSPRLALSLLSMVLLVELLTVSYQMVSTSLPSIAAKYHTTQGAWMLTSFLLVGAVSAPLLGKLADVRGKRLILLTAVGLTAAGALISALAPNYAVVLTGRALQGFLVPCMFLAYSLIRDVYPAKTVALAVSIVTGGMGLITIPSPWLTGWLIDTWGFRAVFWFMLIVVAVLGPMIALTTPESTVRLRSRMDLIGAILLGAGVAGVLIGVSFGPTWGWDATSTLTYIIGGVVLLGAWLVSARVIREPLVSLHLFGRRPVILTALSAGLANGAIATYNVLLAMMCMAPAMLGLHYGFGVDAKGFAIFVAPSGVTGVIGGLMVGLAIKKVQPRVMMVLGLALLAVANIGTGLFHDQKAPIIVFALVFGLGLGMSYAATPNIVIAAVPAELQATTSSMVALFQSGISAILPVVAFSVLNSHIALEVQGNAFYTNGGMKTGFIIAGCAGILGALFALGIPRAIKRITVAEGTDSSAVEEKAPVPA